MKDTLLYGSLVLITLCYADAFLHCRSDEKLENDRCVPCPKCPPGTGLSQPCGFGSGGGLTCEQCPFGKYNDKPDDHVCVQCTNCTYYQRAYTYHCRALVNAECGGCLSGYYDDRKNLLHRDDLYGCVSCQYNEDDPECHNWQVMSTQAPVNPVSRQPWSQILAPILVAVLLLTVGVVLCWCWRRRGRRHKQSCSVVICALWDNCCKELSTRQRSDSQTVDEESLCQNPRYSTSLADNDVLKPKAGSTLEQPPTNEHINDTEESYKLDVAENLSDKIEKQHLVASGVVDDNTDTRQPLKSLDNKGKTIFLPVKSVTGKPSAGPHSEFPDNSLPSVSPPCSFALSTDDEDTLSESNVSGSNASQHLRPVAYEVPLLHTLDVVPTDISGTAGTSLSSGPPTISEASTLLIRGQADPELNVSEPTGPPMLLRYLATIDEENQLSGATSCSNNLSTPLRRDQSTGNDLNHSPNLNNNSPKKPQVTNLFPTRNFVNHLANSDSGVLSLTEEARVPLLNPTGQPVVSTAINSVGNPSSIVFNDGGISIHVIHNYQKPANDIGLLVNSATDPDQLESEADLDQTQAKTLFPERRSPAQRCPSSVGGRCTPRDPPTSWPMPVQETCDGPSICDMLD